MKSQKRKMKKKFHSQYEQDKLINFLLFGKKRGCFVDIGAHDGISYSNSYFFEKYHAWNGLCVEPIPEVFQLLSENRRCVCIEGAASDEDGIVSFVRGTGYVEMLSGIEKFRDFRHIERTSRDIEREGGQISKISVHAFEINNLLSKTPCNPIDFLSIDIEGGEVEILKKVDFERFYIKIICVEINFSEVETELSIFLLSKGFFLLCRQGSDGIFLNKRAFSGYSIPVIMHKVVTLKNRILRKLQILSSKNH